MPDRRADLCRPGQKMFGTRYYYASTRGVDGRRLRAASKPGGAFSYAAADAGAAKRASVAFAAIAPTAPATFEQRWRAWAAGFGGSQASHGNTAGNTALGSNGATSRLFGTAAGADYWFSAHTLAGFALAGGGANFSVVNGGTGRSDLFQAGGVRTLCAVNPDARLVTS